MKDMKEFTRELDDIGREFDQKRAQDDKEFMACVARAFVYACVGASFCGILTFIGIYLFLNAVQK